VRVRKILKGRTRKEINKKKGGGGEKECLRGKEGERHRKETRGNPRRSDSTIRCKDSGKETPESGGGKIGTRRIKGRLDE